MKLALTRLDEVSSAPFIVEVGRMRHPDAGEADGHSTLAFLEYLNAMEAGRLLSIDSDPATEVVCRAILVGKGMSAERLSCWNKDAITLFSIDRIESLIDPIHLLYLDGWDLEIGCTASQKAHAVCFLFAEHLIAKGGLVLIDDTGFPGLGKGRLVIPVAETLGYEVLHEGFQVLLKKKLT